MVINGIIDLDNGELLEATGKHRISALDIQGSETAELKLKFYKNGSAVTDNSVVSGAVIDFGVKADADYTGTSYLIYHDTFSASTDGLEYSGTPTWATAEVETALGNESSVKLHGQVKVVISGVTYYSQVFEVEIHNNVIQAAGTTNSVIYPRLIQSTSDPTVNDDSLDGYGVSSLWLNTSSNAVHVLMDNTAGAAVWAGFLGLTNGQLANNLVFNDDLKAVFGTASDGLEIYHSSNNSYIDDSGTGNLHIRSNGSGVFLQKSNGDNLAKFNTDGAAELYYSGSKKIESTNLGATVTGKLVVSGDLDVDGTTTTFNSTVVTVDDPVFGIGGDTAPGSQDNKDRGVSFRYHDGASAKVGFYGWDNSENAFTFLTDTNDDSTEVFSGTLADLKASKTLLEDGSASAPSVSFSSDNDTGIYRASGDNLAFSTGGTEAARFDSSQNFVIGATTASAKLHVSNGASGFSGSYNARTQAIIESDSASGTALAIMAKNTGSSAIWFGDQNSETVGQVGYNHTNNTLNFATEGAPQAILNTTGLGIGGTPSAKLHLKNTSADTKLLIETAGGNDAILELKAPEAGGAQNHIRFSDDTANVGGITYNHNSGGSDYMQFYTASAERMRIDSSGNVGIANTNPSAQYYSNLVIGNNDSGEKGLTIRSNSSNGGHIAFSDTDSANSGRYAGRISYFHDVNALRFYTTAGDHAMTLDSSQRCGIGTTSPNSLLNVQGDSDPTILINAITGNSANSGKLAFAETDGGAHQAFIKYDGSANRLEIGTSDVAQALVVNRTDGNVGIGTTSPSVKTHIKDTSAGAGVVLRIENDGASGAAQLDLKNDVQSWLINTRTDDHFSVYNNTSATTPFLINTSGKVGIGTTLPDKTLHVNSGAINEIAIFESTDGTGYISIQDSNTSHSLQGIGSIGDQLTLYSNNNERIRIKSDGKVGIGTTTPNELLEVDGNIRLGDGGARDIIGPTNESLRILANPNSSTEGIIFSTDGGTTTEMFIQDGGNVGISTTSPSSLLNLNDANNTLSHQIGFSYESGGSKVDAFTIGRNNSTGNLEFHSDINNHGFEFKHNAAGTQEFNILNMKCGIGTDAPSANADLTLGNGELCMAETTTPTADANFGKIYCKSDNKLYFQDGAGTEHEIAFV
jgi:hypothetical protein